MSPEIKLRWMRRISVSVVAIVLAAIAVIELTRPNSSERQLDAVIRDVEATYRSVAHIRVEKLADWLDAAGHHAGRDTGDHTGHDKGATEPRVGGPEVARTPFPQSTDVSVPSSAQAIVLVDAREEKEFAVSHLPGAVRVNPRASAAELAHRLGDLTGKKVVIYCSVGVRSSQLATRSAEVLHKQGAVDVLNLAGGIFDWHNRGLPVVRGVNRVSEVHPFDPFWGRLVKRTEAISYRPPSYSSVNRQQSGRADGG